MNWGLSTWRLLNTGYLDGATNMAIDEAILLAVAEGVVPPTLRFFGWQPPCLSLGCNQPLADVDTTRCAAQGVDVVRRPTGGRAILHIDELTYSVIAPQGDLRVAGDITESYRRLSTGLLAGLRRLGVPVVEAEPQPDRPQNPSPICFEVPSHYEITVRGRKLIGSAQARRHGCVLQHGALPLHGDVTRIVEYLRVEEEQRCRLRRALVGRAITLEQALGRPVSFDEAVAALASGFAEALDLHLEPGTLTLREQELAAQLRRQRYTDASWIAHR